MLISRRQHALVLAALFGIAAQILFFEQLAGLNVPIAVTLFLVFAWLLRPPATEIHRGDLWIPAAALVFAAFCAIQLEPVIVAFDVLATTALTMASVVVLSGVRVMSLPVLGLVSAGLSSVGHVAVRAAGLVASERSALASAVRRSGRAGGCRLDVGYLVCLGDAAIPELVAQLPVIPEPARTEILRRMHSLVDADPTVPWQSWNLDRERARVAIQSIRDEIERAGMEPGSPVSPRSGGPPGD